MFERTRPPGTWTNLTTLDGSELESFDAKITDAIDGVGGGPYDPSTPISIGGAGLEVTGPFTVTSQAHLFQAAFTKSGIIIGDSEMILGTDVPGLFINSGGLTLGSGNATIGGTLQVSKDAVFDGNVAVNGAFLIGKLIGANTIVCTAGTGGGGGASFEGGVAANSTLTVADVATFNGDVTFTTSNPDALPRTISAYSDLNVYGALRLKPNAHVAKRISISTKTGASTSEELTFGALDSDWVIVAGNGVIVPGGLVHWKITSYGAEEGCEMHLSRQLDTGSGSVSVIRDDGSQIVRLDREPATAATIVFHGGQWVLGMAHTDPFNTTVS